jgi:hypothetical protein
VMEMSIFIIENIIVYIGMVSRPINCHSHERLIAATTVAMRNIVHAMPPHATSDSFID